MLPLGVCNLLRLCMHTPTFWDATQDSYWRQKKFSHASFSTVIWSPIKAVASAQLRFWNMNCLCRLDCSKQVSNSPSEKENMRSNRNRFYTLFLCSLILGVLGWHHETRADSLHLTWSGNSENHDGFEIERRSADSGVSSFIAIVPSS
jgi:hypothetical protein